MYIPHLVTLTEAADYLKNRTGDAWSDKSVLDFALTHYTPGNGDPKPVAFFSPKYDASIGRYVVVNGDIEPQRQISEEWRLFPLFPYRAAQLIASGNTLCSFVYPDRELLCRPDDVMFEFIVPDPGHDLVSLADVRLNRDQLESIVSAYLLQKEKANRADTEQGRDHVVEQIKSDIGKHAVSCRRDQQLKPDWQRHVKKCVEDGIVISNIHDLLDKPGYDEKIWSVKFETLKDWAKKAVPGLKFKPGRPK